MPSSRPDKRPPPLRSAAAAVILILMSAWVISARPSNPHNFQKLGCTHCHLVVPGQSSIIEKKVFRRTISDLCLDCHQDSAENTINHRLGLIPSMKVPEDLHLGKNGELTCITCHMPHLPYYDKRTGGRTYFLRRSLLKRELCLACHYDEGFEEPTTSLKIIAPVNNSLIKNLPIPLIGTVSDTLLKEVTLSINGVPLRLTVKNQSFSTLLTRLQEGVNSLKIEGEKARTMAMTLVFSPDLPEEITYKRYYSHGIQKRADCKLCHTSETTYSISIPDQVLCDMCHETRSEFRYLHGPVAAGSCTVCHDPHGQTNRYFLVQQEEMLCFNCHSEEEVLLHFIDKSKENLELLKTRGCSYCHDPHQSEARYLLRKN